MAACVIQSGALSQRSGKPSGDLAQSSVDPKSDESFKDLSLSHIYESLHCDAVDIYNVRDDNDNVLEKGKDSVGEERLQEEAHPERDCVAEARERLRVIRTRSDITLLPFIQKF